MKESAINIKIRLLQKGIKQKDIAKKAKVSESFVSHVIAGRWKSKRVSGIIKEILEEEL